MIIYYIFNIQSLATIKTVLNSVLNSVECEADSLKFPTERLLNIWTKKIVLTLSLYYPLPPASCPLPPIFGNIFAAGGEPSWPAW